MDEEAGMEIPVGGASPLSPGQQGEPPGVLNQQGGQSPPIADTFHPAGIASRPQIRAASLGLITQTPPVTKPAFPFERVTQLEKAGEGQFMMTTKVPCDSPREIIAIPGDRERVFFISEGRKKVYGFTNDGEIFMEFTPPKGDKVARIIHSPASKALFARNWEGIYKIDDETGVLQATMSKSQVGFGFHVTKKNEIVFNNEKEVTLLDENMKEKTSLPTKEATEAITDLPDGSIVCLHDGCPGYVKVINPEGKTILEEDQLKLYSPLVDDSGRLFVIRDDQPYTLDNPRELIRYDPSDGSTLRIKTANEAESIFPLKDGSFIVFDGVTADSRLIGYSRDGKALWNCRTGKDHHVRHFYLSDDEKRAYFIVDRYYDSPRESERKLYRVDLDSRGHGSFGLGRSFGKKLKPELLHTQTGEPESFVIGEMDDGGIALFESKGISVLARNGAVENNFNSIDDFRKSLKDTARITTQKIPFECGFAEREMNQSIAPNLDALLDFASGCYRKGNASCYGLPREIRHSSPHSYSAFDNSLNFHTTVDITRAMEKAGMKTEKEYEDLLKGHTVLNFAIQDRFQFPFNDGSGITMKVERDRITVEGAPPTAGRKDTERVFGYLNSTFYTCVLPVSAGKRHFIFAATSDGVLHWYDVENGLTRGSYDAGAGIKKIAAGEDNRIYAVNVNNAVLVIEPTLEPGEKLSAKLELSSNHTGLPGDDSIVEEDDFIVVGGVRLEKHPERKPPEPE